MRELSSRQKANLAAKVAKHSKAEDIIILDLRKSGQICDYFVICSASSARRAKAISEAIEEEFEVKGYKLSHHEGRGQSLWILLDYVDIVIHIFLSDLRTFYNIEHLWSDSPRLKT